MAATSSSDSLCLSSVVVVVVHEDIWFQILLWLPVVSLLRFKSVCKSWYSLIERSSFVYQHYHHIHVDRLDEENLIIARNPNFYITNPCTTSLIFGKKNLFQVSENIELPSQIFEKIDGVVGAVVNLIASCNGIICMGTTTEKTSTNFLFNPATKQYKILPKIPDFQKSEHQYYSCFYGFGFSSKTNDYKVVSLVSEMIKGEAVQVDIYNLSTDSWTTTTDAAALVPHVNTSGYGLKTPFRNEIYCWLAYILNSDMENGDSLSTILSFDFSKEVFETIPLPDVYNVIGNFRLLLSLLRDSIVCIETTFKGEHEFYFDAWAYTEFSIWMLNEYGVKESWTKLYTISLNLGFRHTGAWKNGELICTLEPVGEPVILSPDEEDARKELQFCLCNPTTQEIKILPVDPLLGDYQLLVYKDSLVSIKSANSATRM